MAKTSSVIERCDGNLVRGTLLYLRQSGLSFSLLPACLLVCKVPGRTVHLSLLLFEHQPACLLPCLSYCSTACQPAFLTIFLLSTYFLPAWPPSCLLTVAAFLTACLSIYCTCMLLVCLLVPLLHLLAWPSVCQRIVPVCLSVYLHAPITSYLPIGLPTKSLF